MQTLNIQQLLLSWALTTAPSPTCNPISDPPLEKDPIQTPRWEYFNLELSLLKGATLFSLNTLTLASLSRIILYKSGLQGTKGLCFSSTTSAYTFCTCMHDVCTVCHCTLVYTPCNPLQITDNIFTSLFILVLSYAFQTLISVILFYYLAFLTYIESLIEIRNVFSFFQNFSELEMLCLSVQFCSVLYVSNHSFNKLSLFLVCSLHIYCTKEK